MALSGGQMACTMLFGTMILTYLGLEASRLRVLLRVRLPALFVGGWMCMGRSAWHHRMTHANAIQPQTPNPRTPQRQDGVDPSLRASASKHSEPLSMSFPSLYAFFRDSAFLGLILLLAFMCEKFPLYPQGGKEWDRDMYWFVCLLLLVASLMTMRKVRAFSK